MMTMGMDIVMVLMPVAVVMMEVEEIRMSCFSYDG
jgi:hypothetical protein